VANSWTNLGSAGTGGLGNYGGVSPFGSYSVFAAHIVAERRRTLMRGARDLERAGVDVVRAGYFLTLRGRRLATSLPPRQLRLFGPGQHLTQAAWKTSTPPCAYR